MSNTDRGILRKLLESKAPIFGKTLTPSMLRRSRQLEIPLSFLKEHGDRLQTTVLSLTGLNDKAWSVPLCVRTCVTGPRRSPRVYLGRPWIAFATENGFQVGDDVVFWLSASSTFRVLLSSPEFVKRTETTKCDEDCGTSDGAITSEFVLQHSKPTSNDNDILISPPGHVNSTYAKTHRVEAVLPKRQTSKILEEEYFKYPGLNSAVSANLRFPQFLKKLTASNFHGHENSRMELPFSFVKKHADELLERVTLLGASGHLRLVDLRITTFEGQNRVHLGRGWKKFSRENGFSEGGVLLFSLVGVSTFVVKMFRRSSD